MIQYRHILKLGGLMLGLLFLAITAEAAFIRSTNAYLRKTPQYRSENLLKLNKGEEATVLQEQGYWRQVQVRNQTGWVSRLSLIESKPIPKLSGLELKKRQPPRRNIRTRMARAAVGVKGLRASRVAKIEEKYNPDALKKMETFTVNEAKAVQFVMEYQE